MTRAGYYLEFVQDNQSVSRKAGTVRGLHYQAPPFAQAKLMRVVKGAILDVAVDFRRGSPTFGQWVAERLTAENRAQLLIPRGFLHGFVTLEDDTIVIYKVDAAYDSKADAAIRYDDPDIGVEWGVSAEAAILSDKDLSAPFLRDVESPFVFGEKF